MPPGVQNQGLARQRQRETGPAKTLPMLLRCLKKACELFYIIRFYIVYYSFIYFYLHLYLHFK